MLKIKIRFANKGFSSFFKVARNFDYKLPYPYNECYEDIELFPFDKQIIKYMSQRNMGYHQLGKYLNLKNILFFLYYFIGFHLQGCMKLCFNLHYMNESQCNCSANLEDIWNHCYVEKDNASQNSCMNRFKKSFISKDIFAKCSNYCPLECDTVSYSITHTAEPIQPINSEITEVYNYFI